MKTEDISKGSGLNEDEFAFYETSLSDLIDKEMIGIDVNEFTRESVVKKNTTIDLDIKINYKSTN